MLILSRIMVVTYFLQGVYYNAVCYNPGAKVTLTRICAYYLALFPGPFPAFQCCMLEGGPFPAFQCCTLKSWEWAWEQGYIFFFFLF